MRRLASTLPLLDLVPQQDKLVLEVRVQPLDIDVVRVDLPATVRRVAYKQRMTPTLQGKVTRVSAETLIEDKTGTSYYVATMEVDSKELALVPYVKLYPGMPVDVAIVAGHRTFLAYITQAKMDSFADAF